MTTAIERGTELHRAIDEVLDNPNHQPSNARLRAIAQDRANGVVNVLDPLARLVDLNARHRDERIEDYLVSPTGRVRNEREARSSYSDWARRRDSNWARRRAQGIAASEMDRAYWATTWRQEVAPTAADSHVSYVDMATAEIDRISWDDPVNYASGPPSPHPSMSALYSEAMQNLYRQYFSGSWIAEEADRTAPQLPTMKQRAKVDAPSRDVLVRMRVDVKPMPLTAREALATEAEDLLGYTPLRDYVKAPSALRRVLAHLEIEVLDEQTVDAYKKQMVAHYDTHGKMAMPTWRLTAIENYALPIPEFVLRKAVAIKKELPTARFYVDHLAIDPFLIVSMEQEDMEDPNTNRASRHLDANTEAYIECWDEPKFEEGL